MKILVVDDSSDNRAIIKMVLNAQGHQVIEAVNGQQGVDLFIEYSPDLVLMDLKMPVMDGITATGLIKKHLDEQHVPILFLTGQLDDETLSQCLTSGGDDFLYKPISTQVLTAKIAAHLRIRELNKQVTVQKNELANLYDNILNEQILAKTVFQRAMNESVNECANIRHLISAASSFSGDIVLSAFSPFGGLYVLVADFTGHGLPAAIGGLPLSQTFYDEANQGNSIIDIARKLNLTLEKFLPDEMFAAACLVELNAAGNLATIWSGGFPDVLVVGGDGNLKRSIKSQHLALGIDDCTHFNAEVETIALAENDRLYIYSDGLIEAQNPVGERFGYNKLKGIFKDNKSINGKFDEIIRVNKQFCENKVQGDDITLVEVVCLPVDGNIIHKSRPHFESKFPWAVSMKLNKEALKGRSPVTYLTDMLTVYPAIALDKNKLHTILTELFSNAFEHGVLQLSSDLKRSDYGYIEYYEQRQARLDALESGEVKITVEFTFENDKGRLFIKVTDSGEGFDFCKIANSQQNDTFGRGISLVNSLCSNVEYKNTGNQVEVIFELD